jgi:hypothetical protein
MLSIVPLLAGGVLLETGAGGSAPKHVEQAGEHCLALFIFLPFFELTSDILFCFILFGEGHGMRPPAVY